MDITAEESWKKFEASGKVQDYLTYCHQTSQDGTPRKDAPSTPAAVTSCKR